MRRHSVVVSVYVALRDCVDVPVLLHGQRKIPFGKYIYGSNQCRLFRDIRITLNAVFRDNGVMDDFLADLRRNLAYDIFRDMLPLRANNF